MHLKVKNHFIKSHFAIAPVVFSILLLFPSVLLAYSNPVLKVLLFRTTQTVKFSSTNPILVSQGNSDIAYSKEIWIGLEDSAHFRLNNRKIQKTALFLKSPKKISVKKSGTNRSRNYLGLIEIRLAKNGFYVINRIPVEAYLEGVLNAEISTKWPTEVVKAQAVISRTFALYKKHERRKQAWHLSSGLSDQVYHGVNISDQRGLHAIEKTRGIVVTYNGKLAQTFYHSNCGGVTEDAGELWKYSYPYLKVIKVPFGSEDPRFNWETGFSSQQITKIARRFGFKGRTVHNIEITKLSPSGRVSHLALDGSDKIYIQAKDFRRLAGYQKIQSLLFEVIKTPTGYHFKGRGNGHGVGLSQWSAKEMADLGYRYHEILQYFYPGTKLNHYSQ